jgi:short-subunit dehydrogenase
MVNENTIVLITGVSSGIGRTTACLLADYGFTVFGTSRNPNSIRPIDNVIIIKMDLTSESSIKSGVDNIIESKGKIDVIINNAGYMLAGAIEETFIDEAIEQFNINLFGVMRLVYVLLPYFRKARSGKIINIGSALGRSARPFLGIYSASKHALEGYTKSLYHEAKPFNIHATLVEPLYVDTPLFENRKTVADHEPEYDPHFTDTVEMLQRNINNAPPALKVANQILKIIHSAEPNFRYPIDY